MAGKKPGRPSHFTQPLARKVCDALAAGRSLSEVGASPNMPSRRTVLRWVEDNAEFREAYLLARKHQADYHFDQIIRLADAVAGSQNVAEVTAARLQVDSRK